MIPGLNVKASTLATCILTLAAGFIAGTHEFYGYQEKMSQHFEMEARFSDIITDIEGELVKPPQFRLPADVLLQRSQGILDAAIARAPVIPPSCKHD